MKLKKSAKAHKTLSMTVVLEGVMSIRITPSWSHSLLWVPPTFGQQQFFCPQCLKLSNIFLWSLVTLVSANHFQCVYLHSFSD